MDNPDTGVGGIRTKEPPGGEDEDLYPTVGHRHKGAVQVSILGLYNFEYVAAFHLEARPLQTCVRPVNPPLPPLTTPHTSQTEMLYKCNPKMLNQFQYCEKEGVPLIVIVGEEERANGGVKIHDVENSQEVHTNHNKVQVQIVGS